MGINNTKSLCIIKKVGNDVAGYVLFEDIWINFIKYVEKIEYYNPYSSNDVNPYHKDCLNKHLKNYNAVILHDDSQNIWFETEEDLIAFVLSWGENEN